MAENGKQDSAIAGASKGVTPGVIMAGNSKKDFTGDAASKGAATGVNIKPQLLRVSTIVKKHEIDSRTAAAVMTANRLKPANRIEPGKFLKMVEQFRSRTIKQTGRGYMNEY